MRAATSLVQAAGAEATAVVESGADEAAAGSWLVLQPVDRRGRRPLRPDAVFAAHLAEAGAAPPRAGDALEGETGSATWQELAAHAGGGPASEGRVAWAYRRFDEPVARVVLARLQGAAQVFVNGSAYAGDVYRFGFRGVPVALDAGANDVYVTGIRGRFDLAFEEPPAALFLADWDTTRPDLVEGQTGPVDVGVLLVNASLENFVDVYLGAEPGAGAEAAAAQAVRASWTRIDLPALASTHVALSVPRSALERLPATDEDARATPRYGLRLGVFDGGGTDAERVGDVLSLELPLRAASARQRRTFVSAIDRSVQKFSLVPALPDVAGAAPGPTGLIVSLHGASVQSDRQASCYSPKPDAWVVAPTNRRPYGFDWQDWGRLDAYEVMERALAISGAARERIYLTGHSMGGHGTWHLAANDPDRFAAIAPSAGWESFDSYGGRPEGELSELWHAADAASRTLTLIDNLRQLPTYVLHGDADDNVPASEARTMLAALRAAGAEPREHFEAGAGHWWGDQCVDWPPFLELYGSSSRPADPDAIEFVSVDPGVDAEHHWLTLLQPKTYGELLRARGERGAAGEAVGVTTENVGALLVRLPDAVDADVGVALELDGQRFTLAAGTREAAFTWRDGAWRPGRPAYGEKRPGRTGPFKRAFERGFVLVYGTAGDAAEDAVLLARARYDAGVWSYRGNGATELVSDRAFLGHAARYADRNAILYGNRDTNAAWGSCLPVDAPIDASRGMLRVGSESWEGEDLACLFVYPRAGEAHALVGAFADTGVAGARLGATLAPFVSGAGYPDYLAFSSAVLRAGDGGVLAAGFFGADWRISE